MAFDDVTPDYLAGALLLALFTASLTWWLRTRSAWAGLIVVLAALVILLIIGGNVVDWYRHRK